MADTKSSNVGSASHLGDNQLPRDSHFVFDYTERRVPMPVICYMAIADVSTEHPLGESASRFALDLLKNLIEPAVISEEELNSQHMEQLIKESFAQINTALLERAREENVSGTMQVSITCLIADKKRAYLGHAGTNRIYLMHDERLFDLTPTGDLVSKLPKEESPTLFPVSPQETGKPLEEAQRIQKGYQFLGVSVDFRIGYNEVEITPGDTLILSSDGMWKTVTEEEVVENLLTALNVQRSASQLTRLAFSRDSSDNATMVTWKYSQASDVSSRTSQREVRKRHRKERVTEGMLVLLLVLVLCGIFAVGFAFGWRIIDAFRKPEKTSTKTVEESKSSGTKEEKSEQEAINSEEEEAEQQAESTPTSATVKGAGVRMRASADADSQVVGLLRDGQKITVLGETTGADGETWTRARATVRSGGADKEAEGYVRNDFLILTSESTNSQTGSESSTPP